jgi:hypothetical protein
MDDRRVAQVVATAVIAAAACSGGSARAPAAPAAQHAMTAPLPRAAPVDTPRFAGVAACVRCHTAGDAAMRDGSGVDLSPVTQASASMMALSARDPYYLATLQRDLEHVADTTAATELCMRCHAPVGFQEARATGGVVDLAAVEVGSGAAAVLAREGVGCAGCHALAAGTGSDDSDGRGSYRLDRVSFGAIAQPADDAMRAMIHQAVVPSPHVGGSGLCASCHVVVVPAVDGSGEVVEQATYLEWRSSAYAATAGGQTCQDCHMPAVASQVAFSTRPVGSPARDGFRQHAVRGGSAYLLGRLAAHADWLGAAVKPAALAAAADETRAFLATAARLDVKPVAGGVAVTVVNLTGHKLPTGFPSRRMWLHVVAKDGRGNVVMESGKAVAGTIVGAGGRRLDDRGVVLPHVDRVGGPDDVAVWEEVPVGANGRRTHLLLGTARMVKDDRILPAGYAPAGSDAARTRAIGVDGDADFVAGSDTVTVELAAAASEVDVELLYQAIPVETLESYAAKHPEAARFLDITDVPPAPEVMATAVWKR